MSWAETILVLSAATIAVFILHLFLHFRKYTKETPMPKLSPSDDGEPRQRRLSAAFEQGAHEVRGMEAHVDTSMNDVHKLRAQDQAIAQLASQYDEMCKSPWEVLPFGTQGVEWPGSIVPRTQIRANSLIFGFMMNPPAVAGNQRGVSARETLWFLNVGNQKVSATTEESAKALLVSMNKAYFDLIAPYRTQLLKRISTLTAADEVVEWAAKPLHAVCCGQTQVWFESKDEAESMKYALNKAFRPAFDAERRRILDEIAEAAAE